MRHGANGVLAAAVMLAVVAPPAWSRPGAGPLVWHGYRIDPVAPDAGIPKGLLIDAYPKGIRGDYFVGLSSPVTSGLERRLQGAGAELLEYVSGGAFLARMDEPARARVAALSFVSWVAIFQPGHRLEARLRAGWDGADFEEVRRRNRDDRIEAGRPPAAAFADAPLTIAVSLFRSKDAPDVSAQIGQLGGRVHRVADAGRSGAVVLALLPSGALVKLAHVPGVAWIEPLLMPSIQNEEARFVIGAEPGETLPSWLDGSSELVAVADTGLDTGWDTAEMHGDLVDAPVELVSLPVQAPPLSFIVNAGADDGPADVASGHGTHVTGSALGRGVKSAGRQRGTAPGARLFFQAVEQLTEHQLGPFSWSAYELSGLPVLTDQLIEPAHAAGARIHSNSWGTVGAEGQYTVRSRRVDEFVWENPEMVVLFAAGNQGHDADGDSVVDPGSVVPPSTAKNALSIGASENMRGSFSSTYRGTGSPVLDADRIADSPKGLAGFSSRGPVEDGRIKPDLVAPGTAILSTRSAAPGNATYYQDSVEWPSADWSVEGEWALVQTETHTGVLAWHSSPDGDYLPEAKASLTSPVVDVSGPEAYRVLQFWCRFDLGAGDRWQVQLSRDGGASWIQGPEYAGSQADWELVSVYALGFEGETDFRARFVFEADADASTGAGLYIDDVRVLGGVTGSALPSDHGVSEPDEHYVFMSGTSMATPLSAGAAALVRQFLREGLGIETPSAALVRAALVSGAYDLAPGQYSDEGLQEIQPAPHIDQGWGLLNLPDTLDPDWPLRVGVSDQRVGLATGEYHRFKLEIFETGRPIVVTLVYHDYPIMGGGLANDLDLSLMAPDGQVHHPNGLDGPDHVNNVERIVVPAGEVTQGTYTLRIDGTQVVYGPDFLDELQPYALAVRAPGELRAPLETTP